MVDLPPRGTLGPTSAPWVELRRWRLETHADGEQLHVRGGDRCASKADAREERARVRILDVLHTFDELPSWATGTVPSSDYRGRLGGSEDRGQRSAVAYDDRGQVVASARQMTILPVAVEPTITTVDGLPVVTEGSPVSWTRTYDDDHTYVRTASYDHGGRPTAMTLPTDPDYDDGPAPEIGGTLEYNARGLPSRVDMTLDEGSRAIIDELVYTRDGLVEEVHYGDDLEGDGMTSRTPTVSFTTYDDRRRPVRMWTQRSPNAHGEFEEDRPLEDVSTPHDQMLVWDLADNLIAVEDLRDPTEWPDGFRPQSVAVTHDSLYRVAGAEYEYTSDTGSRTPIDDTSASNDWRTEMAIGRSNDPMRTAPAPLVSDEPDQRVVSMTWEHDWLGNMQSWDDDSAVFYERSLGEIVNGADLPSEAPSRRTGALYVASNLPATPVTADDGGWVEVRYGEDGNALAVTVHGRCGDPDENEIELDCRTGTDDPEEAVDLSCAYSCATEQHFTYAWDEVNRIAHARRLDREDGGDWELAVEQRYLYDANNQRTVKTTTFRGIESGTERSALYVYPGDFERRGVVLGEFGLTYDAVDGDTETQYGVGGARIVWRTSDRNETLDRNQRITISLTDLIQSTTAVIDLATGELVESGSYYANGARETYRSNETETVTPEPMGFTGKEADEEVGLTYFGHRYLMAHLGRWASPDPLQTHAVGGGETANGYHYVSANLLQARDPLGLVLMPMVYEFGRPAIIYPTGATNDTEQVVKDAQRIVVAFQETILAENEARARSIMDLADQGIISGDRAVAIAGEIMINAQREANAVYYDPRTRRIEVDDVYVAERSRGIPPTASSTYERLLYVARSDKVATIGYRHERDTQGDLRQGMLDGTEDWAGFSIPWAQHPLRDPGEPDAIIWIFPPEERGPNFGPGGPDDTEAHETAIHTYRQFAGLPASHGGPHQGRSTADNDGADRETHWMWSFDTGESPPLQRHEGAWSLQPGQALPRLSGPHVSAPQE